MVNIENRDEIILVDLTVQEDVLCGYESYQIRLVKKGGKFIVHWFTGLLKIILLKLLLKQKKALIS